MFTWSTKLAFEATYIFWISAHSPPSIELGVLDIFGFENFPQNSFEQLCINLANEQLQHYFTEHIFLQEIEDCSAEGVPLPDVNFISNKATVDMFLRVRVMRVKVMTGEVMIGKGNELWLVKKYFVKYIFLQEIEDCGAEGVPLPDVNFISNKATLDMFLRVRVMRVKVTIGKDDEHLLLKK